MVQIKRISPNYEITESGIVWSSWGKRLKTLKPIFRGGYARVQLTIGGTARRYQVHRLVCEYFNGPPPFKNAVCRHLDGDPRNNHFSNLKWGTQKENGQDAVSQGTHIRGEKVWTAKLTEDIVRSIRQSTEHKKILAQRYGVTLRTIQEICSYSKWKHVT